MNITEENKAAAWYTQHAPIPSVVGWFAVLAAYAAHITAEKDDALRGVGDWIKQLPIPTEGATHQLSCVQRALSKPTAPTPAWGPIETAPRDTGFLAYENGAIYRAKVFCEDVDGDGTVAYAAMCGQPVVHSPEPTHWMPLPNPPQESAP